MSSFKNGDVVSTVRGDAVIVDIRLIERGRRAGQWEFQLAMLDSKSKAFGLTCSAVHLRACSRKYTKAQLDQARARRSAGMNVNAQIKYAQADQRAAVLNKLPELQVGDEVLYRYTNATKWETVGNVNPTTGKIAIMRPEEVIRRARIAAEEMASFAVRLDILGMDSSVVGRSVVRTLRWLPPQGVAAVKRNGVEIFTAK